MALLQLFLMVFGINRIALLRGTQRFALRTAGLGQGRFVKALPAEEVPALSDDRTHCVFSAFQTPECAPFPLDQLLLLQHVQFACLHWLIIDSKFKMMFIKAKSKYQQTIRILKFISSYSL